MSSTDSVAHLPTGLGPRRILRENNNSNSTRRTEPVSNINISRALEHIRSRTNVYMPLLEVVVNAIQAIDDAGHGNGRISITAFRSPQADFAGEPPIVGFEVSDNGIGFTVEHRESFDTLYTDKKLSQGGKGFGRLTCLKYFDEVSVESVFRDDDGSFKNRKFKMGRVHDLITDEVVSPIEESGSDLTTGSTIRLWTLLQGEYGKLLDTVARTIVVRLLPYFVAPKYDCPTITLEDALSGKRIVLNDFIGDSASIRELEVEEPDFVLDATDGPKRFDVQIFQIFVPHEQNRVCLVAHNREVESTSLHQYVPEFEDPFFDDSRQRNYVVFVYVFGEYLDKNVSLIRGGFEFSRSNDVSGVAGEDIERAASQIAERTLPNQIDSRKEQKIRRVMRYVDSTAFWHKHAVEDVDLSPLKQNPSDEDIELYLQSRKLENEQQVRFRLNKFLRDSDVDSNVNDLVKQISRSSKNDLIHYVATRRHLLTLLSRSLGKNPNTEKYEYEANVHELIYPRFRDSDRTPFSEHNLWIVDERVSYAHYVASDKPLNGPKTDRPDILVYNNRVLFRGDNEPSNPVTIFEFKRPQRDDFVDASSKDDPVDQIIRYANDIRKGKFLTPDGRNIRVSDGTPFFGYVVCDATPKVVTWLEETKDFRRMPDGLGWFNWRENIRLYIEVLTWTKVLEDAKKRNFAFFRSLGIEKFEEDGN